MIVLRIVAAAIIILFVIAVAIVFVLRHFSYAPVKLENTDDYDEDYHPAASARKGQKDRR